MTFFSLVSGQASFGRHYKSLMRKPSSRLSLTLDLAPPNEIPSGCCRLSQPFIQTLTSGNLIWQVASWSSVLRDEIWLWLRLISELHWCQLLRSFECKREINSSLCNAYMVYLIYGKPCYAPICNKCVLICNTCPNL